MIGFYARLIPDLRFVTDHFDEMLSRQACAGCQAVGFERVSSLTCYVICVTGERCKLYSSGMSSQRVTSESTSAYPAREMPGSEVRFSFLSDLGEYILIDCGGGAWSPAEFFRHRYTGMRSAHEGLVGGAIPKNFQARDDHKELIVMRYDNIVYSLLFPNGTCGRYRLVALVATGTRLLAGTAAAPGLILVSRYLLQSYSRMAPNQVERK
jgi:hypothetical protein